MGVDGGVFQEFTGSELFVEGFVAEKIVVELVALAGSWWAGGAGDGTGHFAVAREHLMAERGFAAAGWSRNYNQQ